MSESKYGKYIITELNAPDFGPEKQHSMPGFGEVWHIAP